MSVVTQCVSFVWTRHRQQCVVATLPPGWRASRSPGVGVFFNDDGTRQIYTQDEGQTWKASAIGSAVPGWRLIGVAFPTAAAAAVAAELAR